jgi:hypothetical protein
MWIHKPVLVSLRKVKVFFPWERICPLGAKIVGFYQQQSFATCEAAATNISYGQLPVGSVAPGVRTLAKSRITNTERCHAEREHWLDRPDATHI